MSVITLFRHLAKHCAAVITCLDASVSWSCVFPVSPAVNFFPVCVLVHVPTVCVCVCHVTAGQPIRKTPTCSGRTAVQWELISGFGVNDTYRLYSCSSTFQDALAWRSTEGGVRNRRLQFIIELMKKLYLTLISHIMAPSKHVNIGRCQDTDLVDGMDEFLVACLIKCWLHPPGQTYVHSGEQTHTKNTLKWTKFPYAFLE